MTNLQAVRVPADADELTRRADLARVQSARAATTPSISADLPTVGTATQAEYDAAVSRMKASRAAQAPAAGPAASPAAQAQAGQVAPSSLTPEEAASFQRQNANFSQKFPSAPTVQNVQARTNGVNPGAPPAAQPSIAEGLTAAEPAAAAAPSLAQRAGQAANTVGKVARAGTAPVETAGPGAVPGLQKTAPGQRGGTGALLATTGLYSAADSIGRSTDDYRKRLGLGPVAPGTSNASEFAQDLGVRTAGVLSDFGANVLDIGTGVLNAGRRIAGAEPISTFASHFADSPEQAGPAAPGKADFSNVTGGAATGPADAKARLARQAQNEGITPVADRAGNPDEVLGKFNGRPITRAESDRLAGGGGGGNPAAPSIAQGLESSYQPPAGGGVSAGNPGGGAEDRLREINDSSSAAGKIYAALAGDKTPTGKRVAAQFLDTYVGAGTAERGQNASLAGDAMSANASLQRGREGDAAQVEQTKIASKRASQPQYVFGDDGSISQLSDGLLSPVKDTAGQPAKAQKGGSALAAAKTREDVISTMVGKPADYGSPEEYQAARTQALQQLMAELGGAQNGG